MLPWIKGEQNIYIYNINNAKFEWILMEQLQNPLAKSILPNAQIHNLSLSWLGTGTSVKSGGVKLLCVFVIEKKNSAT